MYDYLADYLLRQKFPKGLLVLRDLNINQRKSSQIEFQNKYKEIVFIYNTFEDKKFILVGDSGERDPEVYAKVAQQRRTQIAGVAIRRVPSRRSKQKVESALKILAQAVPSDRLRVFTSADEISDLLSVKE